MAFIPEPGAWAPDYLLPPVEINISDILVREAKIQTLLEDDPRPLREGETLAQRIKEYGQQVDNYWEMIPCKTLDEILDDIEKFGAQASSNPIGRISLLEL